MQHLDIWEAINSCLGGGSGGDPAEELRGEGGSGENKLQDFTRTSSGADGCVTGGQAKMEAICTRCVTGRSATAELVRKGRKQPSEHFRTLRLDLSSTICFQTNIEFITSFHPHCDDLTHPCLPKALCNP